MLNVDGSIDAAVTDRVRNGWNKFRELFSFLWQYVSHKGRVYRTLCKML